MGQRKSEHYNWFNSSKDPKSPKGKKSEKWWKRPLKIAKILSYTTLFSLSLVGCVQSFVIQTNKETGSGVEFYSSKDKVAPHVVTLTEEETYGKNKSISYKDEAKTNYWVKNSNTLSELKKQDGNIGKWKSKTQTLRIENKDRSSVTESEIVKGEGQNKDYLIANNLDKSEDYVYKNINNPQGKPTELYSIKLTKGNIGDMVKDGAKWKDFADFEIKTIPLATEIGKIKGDSLEKKFGLDSYAYLSNKYLSNYTFPAKPAGDITNEEKAWIQNYSTTAQTSGWLYSYKEDENKKITEGFEYDGDKNKKSPSLLSFLGMKDQRAIYSWGGAWHLGPFYALFVYPLAYITGGILNGLPEMGGWEAIIAIMLIVLLVRSLSYALTFKSTLQTVKQQEVQSKVAIINAKYEPYKGNKQMDRRKQQEVQELYKREGVSAFGAMSQMFLTMPLFLSMWRVVGAMPSLKSTLWLGINFAATSYQELFKGAFQYLPLMAITAIVQAAQILSPRLLSKRREKNRVNIYQKQAMKKSNKTQNIMMLVFMFIAIIMSAGLQVYWFFTGLFTIGQNTINHFIIKKQSKNRKRKTGY